MWLKKLLAVLWLCVLWTKVDAADDGTTPKWSVEGSAPPAKTDDRGDELHFGNVETTKTYSADSTVRSFFPVRGKQKWMRRGYPPAEEMLFFNVSIVGDNEEVSLAELHLHRRRIAKIRGTYHKRFLPLPYRVVLYQVQPVYKRRVNRDARTMKLASLPVSYTTKSGWHTLDVTAILRELLINAQGPVELLLGVQFEAPRGLAKSYAPLVPLKHFLKSTNTFDPEHPYRGSSYLVVFSEIDPYFDEVEGEEEEELEDEEEDNPDDADNDIPDGHIFRERHFKHKIFSVKSSDAPDEKEGKKNKEMGKESKEKSKKYKTIENEVYKTDYTRRKEDVVRHKSKHRLTDVKRSKADELALQAKNKLKSLPFLHTNEVEEIRQTSRRLTRSLAERNETRASGSQLTSGSAPKPKDIRRILINHIKKVEKSASTNETAQGMCILRESRIKLSDVDLNVKVAAPASFVTSHCSGSCSSAEVSSATCKAVARKAMNIAYYDARGEMVFVRLDNLLATECGCG